MVLPDGIVSQTCSRTASVADAESSQEEDDDEGSGGVVTLCDDDGGAQLDVPSFGNISVANSSEVHFGNKTFYQGPVTIKQFLYANGGGGQAQVSCDNKDGGADDLVLDAAKLAAKGHDNSVFVNDARSCKTDNGAVRKDEVPETRHFSQAWKGLRSVQKFSQENLIVIISLLAVLIISLGILMVVLLVRHSPPTVVSGALSNNPLPANGIDDTEQDKNTPIKSPLDPSINLTLSGKLKLVSRLEWLAQPPVQPANPLKTLVPYVIIAHTATENCSSQAQCVFQVRFIQTFHIESRNWWDIGYNFLVGGDGEAYQGRGWTGVGSHTYGYNARSIGIAFIGTFNSVMPPARQILACKQLIARGVQLGHIAKDYKLLAHRQLQTTQSPGAVLYADIKTWDHWAEEP